jgi:Bacterial Ig-like domain (group 1)
MTQFQKFFSLLAVLALAACGGGGGGSGTSPLGNGSGSGNGGGGVTPTPKLEVSVVPSTVTAAVPGVVTARALDASGSPIAGQVIRFTNPGGLGKFSSATALTGADGKAVVTVTPLSANTTGADLVVASGTLANTTVTASIGFQLTATDVSLTNFAADIGTAALGPYAQTLLTATLSSGSSGSPVNLSVSSSCVNRGLATLTPATVTTTTGSATFTYRDNGCGADRTDTLQASITGSTSSRSLTLNLTAPTAASVEFVSASPDSIYLRGSGFVENSTVTFRVRDAAGNGVRGQVVLLEPTTLAGGLRVEDLGNAADFPVSRVTDSNGNVLVRVNSGTVPTPVRIRAALQSNPGIATVSGNLSIAVGLPSQAFFSLSQGARNIEGYNVDGTTNTYQIIASDRLGNPVPDGTSINFITEGGQVQSIAFTKLGADKLSRAVANFQTSSPRPVDGRVSVLAYALGEETFMDTNGDNVYSPSELWQDLGDPFLDVLANNFYNSAEDQFIAQLPAASQACPVSSDSRLVADGSIPSRPDTCSTSWGRAYVRRTTETIFSTSAARPLWGTSWPTGVVAASTGTACSAGLALIRENTSNLPAYNGLDGSANRNTYRLVGSTELYANGAKSGGFFFFAADANPVAYNPMAAGTVVSVSATEGLSVSVAGGSPVPSTSAPSGVSINFSFADDATSGTVFVSFRSPGGLTTTVSQRLIRGTAPIGSTCPP